MKKAYEDFTLGLALYDAVPVILFAISMLLIAFNFNNPLFIVGAILSSVSGLLKVVWKLLVVITSNDYKILSKQMRIFMPIGFCLMLLSAIFCTSSIQRIYLLKCLISFPNVLFFIGFIVGMSLMGVCAKSLDSTNSRSNWIEQSINSLAQLSLLIGVILSI